MSIDLGFNKKETKCRCIKYLLWLYLDLFCISVNHVKVCSDQMVSAGEVTGSFSPTERRCSLNKQVSKINRSVAIEGLIKQDALIHRADSTENNVLR